MSFFATLLLLLIILGAGVFLGWITWGDRAGTYYLPESLDERSGWVHDGNKLYVFDRELPDDWKKHQYKGS